MIDLAQFVSRYIVTKDLLRPYDPASVVAERREGNFGACRAARGTRTKLRFATRVVHGIVILQAPDHVEAEGHAWVEWADHSGLGLAGGRRATGPPFSPHLRSFAALERREPGLRQAFRPLSMPLELGPLSSRRPETACRPTS